MIDVDELSDNEYAELEAKIMATMSPGLLFPDGTISVANWSFVENDPMEINIRDRLAESLDGWGAECFANGSKDYEIATADCNRMRAILLEMVAMVDQKLAMISFTAAQNATQAQNEEAKTAANA